MAKKYRLTLYPFIPNLPGWEFVPWNYVPNGFGFIGHDGEAWEFQPNNAEVGPPELRLRITITGEAREYLDELNER